MFVVWIEEDLALQQDAGEEEQAIADAAQGPPVAVAAASEFGVFGSTSRVVLNGDASPMVDRVGQARMAGLPSNDDPALAERLVTGATWNASGRTRRFGPYAMFGPRSHPWRLSVQF